MARMVHSLVYGWVTQNLLTLGPELDRQALRTEVHLAVRSYLTGCSQQTVSGLSD